ncbi:LamB/YcsF family protein (plasmid) [Pantoea sp. C3]|uniref:LamB/YcsF family protein n=1 Tax=Pantoea phytostimulans TaxID=2769024 RepID=UPI0038F70B48
MDIDINTDLGEGYGKWKLGDDEAMMELVSSANVACGFHAGDPIIMHRNAELAVKHGVALGAHIGVPDLWGFGRVSMDIDPAVMGKVALYQIGALAALASSVGCKVTHASAHGAIGMMQRKTPAYMEHIYGAFRSFDPDIIVAPSVNTSGERYAHDHNMRYVGKIFADRSYDDNGLLVSRKLPDAMITDVGAVRERMEQFLSDGTITALSGKVISVDAKCILIHSDTDGAINIARMVRDTIEKNGHRVVPLDKMFS